MSLTAIILAAGASRRMGSPKALLEFRGESFVDRLSGIFARHCDTVIVVVGFHAAAIRAAMRRPQTLIENPSPERGQLSSLQCGLRAAPPHSKGVFFIPVDFPAIAETTVASLAGAFEGSGLAIPAYLGKHGHPILLGPEIASEILELPFESSARAVVHRHRSSTRYLDVDDPGVCLDIDDPAAYNELLATQEAR